MYPSMWNKMKYQPDIFIFCTLCDSDKKFATLCKLFEAVVNIFAWFVTQYSNNVVAINVLSRTVADEFVSFSICSVLDGGGNKAAGIALTMGIS